MGVLLTNGKKEVSLGYIGFGKIRMNVANPYKEYYVLKILSVEEIC